PVVGSASVVARPGRFPGREPGCMSDACRRSTVPARRRSIGSCAGWRSKYVMRRSSAVSSAARLDDAFVETAARVRRELGDVAPDLAFVFVSVHHQARYEAVPALVGAALEPRRLLGCSAGAVIGGGREIEDEPGVSLPAARLDGATGAPIRPTHPAAGRTAAED